MLCGSAFKNKGVQAMLDAVIDYMPAPPTCRRSRASCSTTTKTVEKRRPTTMRPSRRWRSRSRPTRSSAR
jgi:translation elongation factor EF-G